MDLTSLLSALQSEQQKKSSVRLSERNVVELVLKLKQLGLFGDDLLHTINGKEYITTDRLKADIQTALRQAGGRLELTELPALVGVDLVHCEKQVRGARQCAYPNSSCCIALELFWGMVILSKALSFTRHCWQGDLPNATAFKSAIVQSTTTATASCGFAFMVVLLAGCADRGGGWRQHTGCAGRADYHAVL